MKQIILLGLCVITTLISGVLSCVRNYDLSKATVGNSMNIEVDSVSIEAGEMEEITLLNDVNN